MKDQPSTDRKEKGSGFASFATTASRCLGSQWAFLIAAFAVVGWLISAPILHFSNKWQLVINTGTTIVTFLMVFLIQNTQNRDAKAMNLKLDELIKASKHAEDHMVDIESLSEAELDRLQEQYASLIKEQPDKSA